MELIDYLAAIRRRWPVIALLLVLGTGLGFGVARTTTPSYTATAKVFVSLSGGQTTSDLLQGSTYIKNLIESYTALIELPVVLDPVVEELGLDGTGRQLAGAVAAESQLNTSIIEIKVRGTDAAWTADVANAVANQVSVAVGDLTGTPADEAQSVTISVVSPADTPRFPSEPRTKFLLVSGALGGLAVGVVVALLWALLDTRLRDPDDLDPVAQGLAVLGLVPRTRRPLPLSVLQAPLSTTAEAYRKIQTNLRFVDLDLPARLVVVTSSVAGEGKSTSACNLAAVLAESGRRVLVIDADMRRPSIPQFFGIESAAGLTTILVGRTDLEAVAQPVAENIDVLTVGEIPPNPHQLVSSPAMRALLERARTLYDVVVVDAPPVLPVSDAAVLATMADGTIVVAGCRKVTRQQVAQTLRTLGSLDARMLGLVMTFAPRGSSEVSYYGGASRRRGGMRAFLRRGSTGPAPVSGARHVAAELGAPPGERADDGGARPRPVAVRRAG